MAHCHHALIGVENEEIIQNYNRVRRLGLYSYSYGMRNHRELFASLRYYACYSLQLNNAIFSVAFLNGFNDYYPYTRNDLFEHDPMSFQVIFNVIRCDIFFHFFFK